MANNFKNQEQREHWNRYNNEYSKKTYRTITIKLNKNSDKDVIDYIDSQSGTATSIIRKLVREKI